MKKFLVMAAAATFTLGLTAGCNKQQTKTEAAPAPAAKAAMPAAPKTNAQLAYENALKDAKTEKKKAAAVGGEWRDTGKILKKADKAAKKGDYGTAKKLAQKAAFQGRAGQEQAASQVGVGNPGYLYR